MSDRTTVSPRATKEIEECREHAAHCARQANDATCPEMREDFLRLEQNWLQLARSYERARGLVRGTADGSGDESAHRSRFV